MGWKIVLKWANWDKPIKPLETNKPNSGMVLGFAELQTQRLEWVCLPFWKWAEPKGWLMTWFPGWRDAVWGDAVGYWCRSLFGSRCLIEQTWWLHSSRWHGRLPRTTLACQPTAAKHQNYRLSLTGLNHINVSTLLRNTWSGAWLPCKLLWGGNKSIERLKMG